MKKSRKLQIIVNMQFYNKKSLEFSKYRMVSPVTRKYTSLRCGLQVLRPLYYDDYDYYDTDDCDW